MGYLKTTKVFIDSIDEEIELVEMSALGQRELLNANVADDSFGAAAATVKWGTTKWRECSIEEILGQLPVAAIMEISTAVADFSGAGEDAEKNLESTPSDDSISV